MCLGGQESNVGMRVSIWNWEMEAELGKIVSMTSGQPPDKAMSNLLYLTLL